MLNFIELFLFIFSCIITTTVYYILGKLFLTENKNNFYDHLIFGVIIASFISLTLNFILPLSRELNSVFQILIICIFFIIYKKKIYFSEIKKIIVISLSILILISFDTENRPDAYLYHLPYSQILNDYKIITGVSNLHFRFGHTSIFQYLSSFNYTIFSELNGLLVPSALFCITIFLYFLNDLLLIFKDKKNISFGKLFSLLIFTYISFRINRYSEFGNDAMSHLTVFYLVSKFIYLKNYKLTDYKKILLLCIFSFLNKSFLIFTFIIPAYIFFKKKLNIKKSIINFPMIVLFFWIIKNILISGCAIYPVKITCFSSLKWVDIQEVSYEAIKAEAWAKGWPERERKNITQSEFNKQFNWIKAWKKDHLYVFLKNLVPFLIFIFLLFIFCRDKNVMVKLDNQKKIVLLLFSSIGTVYFLLKFPLYRYGYSYLIVLISVLFLQSLIRINYKKFVNLTKILIIFCIIGIFLKQGQRIQKYHELRTLIPSDRSLPKIDQENIEKIQISKNFYYYKTNNKGSSECKYFKSPCTNIELNNIYHKKIGNYDFIFKNY